MKKGISPHLGKAPPLERLDAGAIHKEVHRYALLAVESPNVWVKFLFVKRIRNEHKRIFLIFIL